MSAFGKWSRADQLNFLGPKWENLYFGVGGERERI
jgi:hypothetical protein